MKYFFLEGETDASQIWPTLRKATPLVYFPKALKRRLNNAGPALKGLMIMKGIGLLISKGIGLLIMKGIGLMIRKGIGLLIMKGIGLLIR